MAHFLQKTNLQASGFQVMSFMHDTTTFLVFVTFLTSFDKDKYDCSVGVQRCILSELSIIDNILRHTVGVLTIRQQNYTSL